MAETSVFESQMSTKTLDATHPGGSVSDYFALLKPRVMSLVIFTALVGMVVAPSGQLHPVVAAIALLCIAVGAGASGALNMWYDADIDRVMKRTAKRPIPAGALEPQEALVFGIVLSIGSVVLLGLAANWLAAGLLAFTIFFYAVIYTMWLKRSTPQNIVIGGAAGAFPPMVGWVAMTGSISLESFVLFLIIFMWTPPHFWALALFKRDDYEAANIPMLPNVAGDKATRLQIFLYAAFLAPLGVLPFVLGFAGVAYGVVSAVLGAVFLYWSFRVWRDANEDGKNLPAKKLFGFSIFYLFALFATLLAEAIVLSVWSF